MPISAWKELHVARSVVDCDGAVLLEACRKLAYQLLAIVVRSDLNELCGSR